VLWTFIPLVFVVVTFLWGTISTSENSRARKRPRRFFCHRKAMECGSFSIPKARWKSMSCTCLSTAPHQLTMTSEDVIHNFYGSFRVRKTIVPGMYTSIWFQRP